MSAISSGVISDLWTALDSLLKPVDNQHLRRTGSVPALPRRDTPRRDRIGATLTQRYSSGAMSTLTFMVEDFASVKITPLTGVTSA